MQRDLLCRETCYVERPVMQSALCRETCYAERPDVERPVM